MRFIASRIRLPQNVNPICQYYFTLVYVQLCKVMYMLCLRTYSICIGTNDIYSNLLTYDRQNGHVSYIRLFTTFDMLYPSINGNFSYTLSTMSQQLSLHLSTMCIQDSIFNVRLYPRPDSFARPSLCVL